MARQHSLATRAQAIAGGLTPRQIGFRLETGLWVAPHRGIYRPSSVRPYFELEVMAACLALDGYASHSCAGSVYGLRGFEKELIQITVTSHRRRGLDGVLVRRRERIDGRDVTIRWHLPIPPPAKTLLDIADQRPDLAEFGASRPPEGPGQAPGGGGGGVAVERRLLGGRPRVERRHHGHAGRPAKTGVCRRLRT